LNDTRPHSPAEASDDPRLQLLRQWLERDLGFSQYGIAPASADASFRRYFRVTRVGEVSLIVMDAPPGKEDVGPYLRIAAMLQDIGVHAPRILQRSERDGFLLLTDLGTTMYLPELTKPGQADRLYADALAALVQIQSRGVQAAAELPPYDEKLLRFEMSLFPDWLLQRHLALELSPREAQVLQAGMDALVANALAQPQVFVHRDYHSRNLMVCPAANPGIIDFQDAVRGALTYDLVSLLRDLMGVQRHLKVGGIFARLCHRDGKPGYLADIPRTLQYAVDSCARHADFIELGELIGTRVLPAVIARLEGNAP